MKDLLEIFSRYPTDKPKYADFYRRHFAGLNPELLLEIGVLKGGSHHAWKEIFPAARVVGIDIEQLIKDAFPDLEIYIGDQTDLVFLDTVINEIGYPDIIIDDGGHSRKQQIVSFIHLYPKMKIGGLYIIEDLETSFLEAYNDSELSSMDFIRNCVLPTDWDGNVKGRKPGDVFQYIYSQIVFERNVCLIKK